MFSFKNLRKSALTFIVVLLSLQFGHSQTMIPLPAHASVYTGNIRGMWFTAPVDFVITGLRVPSQAGTGLQYIQVFKINDNVPVVYATTSTNFTSLGIVYGATNGVIQSVNIPISAGDKIGVVGQAGTGNSYGTVSGSSNIDGYPITLARIGYQGNMTTTGIANYWTEPSSSSISRVEVYYTTCSTAVTQNPVSKTVCENTQATFSITAADATVYKWQVDEGSGFFNLTNGTNYAGATTNTLSVNNTPASFNGYQYRCMAYKNSSSSTSCVDTSNIVTLTVNGLVKTDPLAPKDTTCIHSTKDIELKGTGAITNYTWQKFNTTTGLYEDIVQAPPYIFVGNILRIAGVPDTLDGTKFRCIVDGICNNTTSTELQLTVSTVPKVSVPPTDVLADHGDDVFFEVQASAAGARYQWQAAAPDTFVNINDGGIYQGVKTTRLYIKGVSRVQDNFKFRCIVNGTPACNAPGDTSSFGILNVNPPASVNGLSDNDALILYPNPTTGAELYIKTIGSLAVRDLKYKVVDKTGRTMLIGNISSAGMTKIDIGRLSADLYLVEIIGVGNEVLAKSRFTKL